MVCSGLAWWVIRRSRGAHRRPTAYRRQWPTRFNRADFESILAFFCLWRHCGGDHYRPPATATLKLPLRPLGRGRYRCGGQDPHRPRYDLAREVLPGRPKSSRKSALSTTSPSLRVRFMPLAMPSAGKATRLCDVIGGLSYETGYASPVLIVLFIEQYVVMSSTGFSWCLATPAVTTVALDWDQLPALRDDTSDPQRAWLTISRRCRRRSGSTSWRRLPRRPPRCACGGPAPHSRPADAGFAAEQVGRDAAGRPLGVAGAVDLGARRPPAANAGTTRPRRSTPSTASPRRARAQAGAGAGVRERWPGGTSRRGSAAPVPRPTRRTSPPQRSGWRGDPRQHRRRRRRRRGLDLVPPTSRGYGESGSCARRCCSAARVTT